MSYQSTSSSSKVGADSSVAFDDNSPGGSGIGSTGRRRALREGEWACVDARCAHINSDRRHSCEKCGKAKPRVKSKSAKEIGKEAADKSKGLFSAEDWVCAKCGNVNWARRTTCNICNAPRVCETEIRTGYGGGYMDRQVVEYKERREIDDEEFDEFGRKKKSKKQLAAEALRELTEARQEEEDGEAEKEIEVAAGGSHERQENAEQVGDVMNEERDEDAEEGEEDDEDEGDDEDIDIAKYDLFADPELASLKINLAKQKVAEKNGDEEGKRGDFSSECSCSCSGGECSCSESDDEAVDAKRSKLDEKSDRSRNRSDHHRDWERRREHGRDSPTRVGAHHPRNGREQPGTRGGDDHHSRGAKYDHRYSGSRERKRSRERSNERHHHHRR